jgi:hypothetical protein
MKAADVRRLQAAHQPSEEIWWLMEIVAELDQVKRALQRERREEEKPSRPAPPAKPQRKPVERIFYAVEYVPSLPVKIDILSREKPVGGYQHMVRGFTADEARAKLITRLTEERSQAHQQYEAQEEAQAQAQQEADDDDQLNDGEDAA